MSVTNQNGKTLQEKLRAMPGGISASTLAPLLGISKIKLYKMASGGDVPCVRIGTSVRFDPEMIARWIDYNEVAR